MGGRNRNTLPVLTSQTHKTHKEKQKRTRAKEKMIKGTWKKLKPEESRKEKKIEKEKKKKLEKKKKRRQQKELN